MVRRGNYYYKYICIWNNETKTKEQAPVKLAHTSEYEKAIHRKGEVERVAVQQKEMVSCTVLKIINLHG